MSQAEAIVGVIALGIAAWVCYILARKSAAQRENERQAQLWRNHVRREGERQEAEGRR